MCKSATSAINTCKASRCRKANLKITFSFLTTLWQSFYHGLRQLLNKVKHNHTWRSVLHWTVSQYHYGSTTPQPFYGPFFRDHPCEPVPEDNFWTLWCKGRLTEADTLTIRAGVTPSRLTSAYLCHPPYFLQARCPSCRPTNSVKALKATSAFGLGRRC